MIRPVSPALLAKAVAVSTLLTLTSLAQAAVSDFATFDYDLADDNSPVRGEMPGRFFSPTDLTPNTKYPLIIFFCGSGEILNSGRTNLDAQVNSNIDNLLAAAKTRKFYIYAPQSPGGWQYDRVEQSMAMALKAIADPTKQIDPQKVYVTGLSLGGRGCRCAYSHFADLFAAAIPICSDQGQTESEFYTDLGGKPIWAFHAINDPSVNVSASRNFINNIRGAEGKTRVTSWPINNSTSNPFYNNGSPYWTDGSTFLSSLIPAFDSPELRYTKFVTGGHGIWSSVFGQKTPSAPTMIYPLYDWLLSKSLPAGLPAALQPGETLLFDLGATRLDPSRDTLGRYWNGTVYVQEKTTGVAAIASAVTTQGYRTPVQLHVTTKFGNTHKLGLTTGTPYADSAISWDGWTTVSGSAGIFQLSGLKPGAPYQLKVWASHSDNDGTFGRDTRYEISNAVPATQDLAVYNNTATVLTFSANADLSGVVSVKVYPKPGTTSRYGVINTLEVTALKAPASAWNLNETSGTVASDVTGLQSGTLGGNAAWTSAGKYEGGVAFDGNNDWISVPTRPGYSGSAVTLSLWFNNSILDGQARGLISKRVGVFNQVAYSIFIGSGNRIYVDIGTGTGTTIERFDTGYTLSTTGTWRHLAVVFDGALSSNRLKVYLDGAVILQAQPTVAAILNTTAPLYIGSLNANYGYAFSGSMDQVKVYDQALSSSEVAVAGGY